MERVNELIEKYRCCSRNDRLGNFADDEWLKLEQSLEEFLDEATEDEKNMLDKNIPMESVYMVCSGIRWEKEKNKSI